VAARALFRSCVRHFDAAEPGDLNRRRSTAVNRSRSNNGSKSNTYIPQQADILSDAYNFAGHSHKGQHKISATFSAQRPLLTELAGRALDIMFAGCRVCSKRAPGAGGYCAGGALGTPQPGSAVRRPAAWHRGRCQSQECPHTATLSGFLPPCRPA
jgi:hypothetical protein